MNHLTGLKQKKFPATGMERGQKESLLGEVSPSSHPGRSAVRGMERVSRASLGQGLNSNFKKSKSSIMRLGAIRRRDAIKTSFAKSIKK